MISYLENSNELLFEKKVDKGEYYNHELVSVKVILSLPYPTSSLNYENAFGSLNINGHEYRYIKRRIYNDTLELLCLPNHENRKLQLASNEFAKSFAEGQATVPLKKNSNVVKVNLPDLYQPESSYEQLTITPEKNKHVSTDSLIYLHRYASQPDRPPQMM
jgi:hypothetical protein